VGCRKRHQGPTILGEIVVCSAGDSAGQKEEIDSDFLELPGNPKNLVSLELFLQVVEKLSD
jgi:hypothetical protein